MKNRLSSRLRLTLSGVTLLTLLLMCVLAADVVTRYRVRIRPGEPA